MGIDKQFFEIILNHIESELKVYKEQFPETKRTEGDKQGVKLLGKLIERYRELVSKNGSDPLFFSETLVTQIKGSIITIENSIPKDGWFSNKDPQITKSILSQLPKIIKEAADKASRNQSQTNQIELRLKQVEESNKNNETTIQELKTKSEKAETENKELRKKVGELNTTTNNLVLQKQQALNFFVDLTKTGISAKQIEEFFEIFQEKVPQTLLEPPKTSSLSSIFSETYLDLDPLYTTGIEAYEQNKKREKSWLSQCDENQSHAQMDNEGRYTHKLTIKDRWKLLKALPNVVFAAIHELVGQYNQVQEQNHKPYIKTLIYRLIDMTLYEQEDYLDLPWKQRVEQVIQNSSTLAPQSQEAEESALDLALEKIKEFKFSGRLPNEKLENRFAYLGGAANSGYWIPKDVTIAGDYAAKNPEDRKRHYYNTSFSSLKKN